MRLPRRAPFWVSGQSSHHAQDRGDARCSLWNFKKQRLDGLPKKYSTSLAIRGSQTRNTLDTHWDGSNQKDREQQVLARLRRHWTPHPPRAGMWNGAATGETASRFFKTLNLKLPYDAAMPLLGIYPREMKAYVHTENCTWEFSHIIPSGQKVQTVQMPINRWVDKKTWCTHILERFSVIRRNELLMQATAQRQLQNTMARERSHFQKATYYSIPFTWNVQGRQLYRHRI